MHTFKLTPDGTTAQAHLHTLNFARIPQTSMVQAPDATIVSEAAQNFRADTIWHNISDLPSTLIDSHGTTTTFEYVDDDPTGYELERRLLKKKTSPDGRVSEYEYDGVGRVTRAFDNRGNDSSQTYDVHGNVSSVTDNSTGLSTYYFYDVRGNRIRQEGPTSTTVLTWTYDDRGNVLASTDAEEFETVREYNSKDQLTTVTRLGQTVSYLFDSRDRMTTTVDTLGNQSGNDYDLKGFLLRSRDALGNTSTTITTRRVASRG